jgi:MYXO-CTERM domain-containing protein
MASPLLFHRPVPSAGAIPILKASRVILCITAAGLFLSVGFRARGGVISYVGVSGDTNSGISTNTVYQSAVDGGSAAGTTINGVFFAPMDVSGIASNLTMTVSSGHIKVKSGNTQNYTASGALGTMFSDFLEDHSSAAGATETLTLAATSLTLGKTYDARLYIRNYSGAPDRLVTIRFDEDGAGPLGSSTIQFNEDAPTSLGFSSDQQAYFIDYRYTSDGVSPLLIDITEFSSPDSFLFYGFDNELAVSEPSPASIGLIGLGGLVMVALWRQPRRRPGKF